MREFKVHTYGKTIQWYCDSLNAVAIVNRGSMNESLHEIVLDIKHWCDINHVRISPKWIPRNLNNKADRLSRLVSNDHFANNDNWFVLPHIYDFFDRLWGPHSYDRFPGNTHFTEGSKHTSYSCLTKYHDIFNDNWDKHNNWVVPKISLIGQTIKHLIKTKAKATMIVPKWKSASFWPLLVNQRGEMREWISEHREYRRPRNFYGGTSNLLSDGIFNSNILILNIRF